MVIVLPGADVERLAGAFLAGAWEFRAVADGEADGEADDGPQDDRQADGKADASEGAEVVDHGCTKDAPMNTTARTTQPRMMAGIIRFPPVGGLGRASSSVPFPRLLGKRLLILLHFFLSRMFARTDERSSAETPNGTRRNRLRFVDRGSLR
jgi:hypothetical protein